jgi:protein-disulfide isomerase
MMSLHLNARSVLEWVTSLATLAAALAIVWTVAFARANGSVPSGPAVRSPVTSVAGLEITLAETNKHHDGAKVAIIEFSDFECPYCGRYARDIYPEIKRAFVDSGIVDYSFRNFPLESIHKAALKAGEASVCAAEQGKFWEMHDQLFQNQKQLTEPDLVRYASTLSLDVTRFGNCLKDQVAERIRRDQDEAKKFDINATPSFLVGLIQSNGKVKVTRKVSGAQSLETFRAVIDEVRTGV